MEKINCRIYSIVELAAELREGNSDIIITGDSKGKLADWLEALHSYRIAADEIRDSLGKTKY